MVQVAVKVLRGKLFDGPREERMKRVCNSLFDVRMLIDNAVEIAPRAESLAKA